MDDEKAFYHIYSLESFVLRPRDNIYLDLKFKFNKLEQLEPWINLLSCLKEQGFKIEDYNWASNELKDGTIQLHILNRDFTKKRNACKEKIKQLHICFYLVKHLMKKLLLNIVL